MANHLARIFGTEEDRVNCPFYFKIGACRHGDRCSRTHQRPLFSATVMIPNMYQLPPAAPDGTIPHEQQHFEDFWEEIVDEFQKFGDVLECNVSTNMGDHLNGNVYIKFGDEDQAAKALSAINGRFYSGRTLKVEFSPVTNFREARCRAYDEGHCNRGGFCNFMHVRPVPKHLAKLLDGLVCMHIDAHCDDVCFVTLSVDADYVMSCDDVMM